MKKVLKMSEIDCANCAAAVERGINRLESVETASVSFITKKTVLEIKDGYEWQDVFKAVKKEVKKVEPDCEVTE